MDDSEVEEFEEPTTVEAPLANKSEKIQLKNRTAIEDFLGEGNRVNSVAILPEYYGELQAWALQRHIEKDGWKVVRTLGFHWHEPTYMDVNTDCNKRENLLVDADRIFPH